MNDFERDNAWQRKMRDELLAPFFYRRYALEGRYVFIDKGRLASVLQQRYAVDTILQSRHDGGAVCIEEKIARWPEKRGHAYDAFSLETKSCTVPGHESSGWMIYGESDYLLYCFQTKTDGLDCHLIDFPKLQKWFWANEKNFPTFGPLRTFNGTAGRVVPIDRVKAAVPHWRFPIERVAK